MTEDTATLAGGVVNTASATIRTAAARVFDTTELLEHILLQDLPMQDIARARQINSFSLAVIDNSKHLQRALFLEAAPVRETIIAQDGAVQIVTKLHPVLQAGFSTDKELLTIRPSNMSFWALDELDSSWKSMFICQPPCATFDLVIGNNPFASRFSSCIAPALSQVKGNTLGSLWDAVQKHHGHSYGAAVWKDEERIKISGFMSEDALEVRCERLKIKRGMEHGKAFGAVTGKRDGDTADKPIEID